MIVRAAIKKDDRIFTGRRHCEIINKSPLGFGGLKFGTQGFVNDKDEFLTRKEAKIEAIACGQINKNHIGLLFSEDLW